MVAGDRTYDARTARIERHSRTAFTEDEVRKELADLGRIIVAGSRISAGGRIVLAAPMIFTKKVSIRVPGITIVSTARFPIRASGVVDCLFDVMAELFCVEGLLVLAAGDENYFETFVRNSGTTEASRSSLGCRVLNNEIQTDRIYVDLTEADADEALIFGNRQFAAVNGTHDPSILINSDGCRVEANKLDDGGGADIFVNSEGSNCAIVGNMMNGSDIDTSSGNGGCRLAGNVEAGAKLLGLLDLDADQPIVTSQTLNGANPTIQAANKNRIRLTFDAGSSGNAALSDGLVDGQLLTLFCVSYAGTATLPDNTANNVKLSAAWTPTADDQLVLEWDATDGNWIEKSRSAN